MRTLQAPNASSAPVGTKRLPTSALTDEAVVAYRRELREQLSASASSTASLYFERLLSHYERIEGDRDVMALEARTASAELEHWKAEALLAQAKVAKLTKAIRKPKPKAKTKRKAVRR